jgi:hypothetical protein
MKRVTTKALAGAVLAGAIGSGGCYHYQKCVDPCWPERYSFKARQEVISAFAPQVQNGHILDQTLYNTAFEAGSDKLSEIGRDQLDTLVRRRPCPDPRVFLATTRDISYDANNPDTYAEVRRDLDNKRAAAVQRYLAAQTAGRPIAFEIVVHDPMPVFEHADPANRSIRFHHNGSHGTLSGGASATTASSTGANSTNGGGGASGGFGGGGAGAGAGGGMGGPGGGGGGGPGGR